MSSTHGVNIPLPAALTVGDWHEFDTGSFQQEAFNIPENMQGGWFRSPISRPDTTPLSFSWRNVGALETKTPIWPELLPPSAYDDAAIQFAAFRQWTAINVEKLVAQVNVLTSQVQYLQQETNSFRSNADGASIFDTRTSPYSLADGSEWRSLDLHRKLGFLNDLTDGTIVFKKRNLEADLKEELGNPDPSVRGAAGQALAELFPGTAGPTLTSAISSEENLFTKAILKAALCAIEG